MDTLHRLEELLALPEELEAQLQRLDRQSAETALNFEALGRRAGSALGQILLQGRDVESVMQRIALSLSNEVLRQAVSRPITGILEAAAGNLLPMTTAFPQPPTAPPSSITINVTSPGGDPGQLRRSLGRAASELARVVAQGQRYR